MLEARIRESAPKSIPKGEAHLGAHVEKHEYVHRGACLSQMRISNIQEHWHIPGMHAPSKRMQSEITTRGACQETCPWVMRSACQKTCALQTSVFHTQECARP